MSSVCTHGLSLTHVVSPGGCGSCAVDWFTGVFAGLCMLSYSKAVDVFHFMRRFYDDSLSDMNISIRKLFQAFNSSQTLINSLHSVSSLLGTEQPLEQVCVQGWVTKVHSKGKFMFIHLNDGRDANSLQIFVPNNVCKSVSVGSAVRVVGSWLKSVGRQQAMELVANEFVVLGPSLKHEVGHKYFKDKPYLKPKFAPFASLLRFRSKLYWTSNQFFQTRGFLHVDPPVITMNDCEGGGATFSVAVCWIFTLASNGSKFFDCDELFLPVSSQLHLESFISGIPKVYCIGSAFRAEKSLSRQHLAEFQMLEAEIGFINNLDQLCDFVESFVRVVVKDLKNDADLMLEYSGIKQEFCTSADSVEPLLLCMPKTKFPRMSFNEAKSLLKNYDMVVSGNSLTKEQELKLVHLCNSPVFVTYFPSAERPFYMSRTVDGKFAECFDLLTGIVGELAGGSLRETDPEKLRSRNCAKPLEWYIHLRECGQPPSGGFGIGVDRLLQSVLGLRNIKDTIAFPRCDFCGFFPFRYILMEILLSEHGQTVTDSAIYNALCKEIIEIYGDFGFAAAKTSLFVKVFDSETGVTIVRISAESCQRLLSSIPFVRSVNNNLAVLKVLFVGT
uniref:AA_TRNA_LIGASE_II domain-containing protein n=1 Tax=Syphacia muris TaxID=451379 RepID=A0A158R575_9BILA